MRTKYRIRFAKAGDLRFLSHHDLLRLFERMFRRAALPFRSTEGFHPKPKMAFVSALALGIIGRREVLELELDQPVPPEEVRARLARQCLPGLEILSVEAVPISVTGQAREAVYRLRLDSPFPDGLPQQVAALLQRAECWVERQKPRPRRVDIRPYLSALWLDEAALWMRIAITSGGSARPEEVLRILGLEDRLMNGSILERMELRIEDERPAATPATLASSRWQPAAP
jgi:radical SAM-linked protein